MKIHFKDFRVAKRKEVELSKWPTVVNPVYKSKKEYSKILKEQVEEFSSLHHLHYAADRYAVLLIFQAMDAAAKDGAIHHVMSGVNPRLIIFEIILDTFRGLRMAYPRPDVKRRHELQMIRKGLEK